MNKTTNENNKENLPWYMKIFDENLITKAKKELKEQNEKEEERITTNRQNVKAILECIFAGFKDELIEVACERICELDENNNIKKEIEDAFLTVGIMIRAKVNELCNEHKFEDAQKILDAYEVLNKYFDDKLQWREI